MYPINVYESYSKMNKRKKYWYSGNKLRLHKTELESTIFFNIIEWQMTGLFSNSCKAYGVSSILVLISLALIHASCYFGGQSTCGGSCTSDIAGQACVVNKDYQRVKVQ